jgi:3-oxoadipate enol-lactonase
MEIDTVRGRIDTIDCGHGPPLVLLHAFPLSNEAWRGDADVLSARFRVLAPSSRGFGRTEAFTDEPSLDGMAADLAALLDALRVTDPVVLAGLSMGGYTALSFARRYPGRLRALVLADTRAEPDSAEGRAARDQAIARIEGGDRAGWFDQFLANVLGPTTRRERPEVEEAVRELAAPAADSAIIDALRALRDRPDARPGLSSIAVPTLVVVGEEDTVTPPASSRLLFEAIPGSELVTLPRVGHFANLEAPIAFREALSRFLASL